MKILHMCLSCFYIDGYAYQENQLVAQNVRDGHEVLVIASTESFGPDRRVCYLQPGEYKGTDGARVIRLPYRYMVSKLLSRKIRAHPSVYSLISAYSPDIIFFHGLSGWELLTAATYRRNFPKTSLFVDCHEDFNNSARSFLSKWGLHWLFYRRIVRAVYRSFDRVYGISLEAVDFATRFYGLPKKLVEFLPLGGDVLDDVEYESRRRAERARLNIDDNTVLFVQSGKIDRKKRLDRTLSCLGAIQNDSIALIIAGHLQEEVCTELESMIANDPRVQFIGWRERDEMTSLLCAADVYVQPGSQSATMQAALCSRCAVIIDNVPSHVPFVKDNGWLVGSSEELGNAIAVAGSSPELISRMSRESLEFAIDNLGYSEIARRIYSRHSERVQS